MADNSDKIKLSPKITGIGGVFFKAKAPGETKDWYAKNLGMEINAWGGVSFEARNISRPDTVESTQWSLFKPDDNYFAPSEKEFMINYRVQNMEGLIAQLKENGVTLLDELQDTEYGKFVHLMDNEGNKIELWEPKIE